MRTLAQFELNHNFAYMGITAYLWKKMKKTPENEPCLKISADSPGRKVSWSRFVWWSTRSWTWEQETQSSVRSMTQRDSASAGVFSRKGGRNKSWKYLYQRGKRTENVLDSRGQFVANLRSGFLLDEWTRSWALLDLLQMCCPTSTVWLPTILTVLRYSLSPKSLTWSLKANAVNLSVHWLEKDVVVLGVWVPKT